MSAARAESGFDLGGVLDDLRARRAGGAGVLHRRLDVLDQRSVAPDVERLGAVADGEDGLAHVVRVLQEKLVDVVARRIGRGWCGDAAPRRTSADRRRRASREAECRRRIWRAAWLPRLERSSAITTGSPPAPATEFTYSGRARVEYSGSELGTGMAMRGFMGR